MRTLTVLGLGLLSLIPFLSRPLELHRPAPAVTVASFTGDPIPWVGSPPDSLPRDTDPGDASDRSEDSPATGGLQPIDPARTADEATETNSPDSADRDTGRRLESLANDGSEAARDLRRVLIRTWAGYDRTAAVGWAMKLPEGQARVEALEQVVLAWSDSDLPGAMAWAEGLPQGESRNSTLLSLGYEAARADPLLALRLGTQLETTPQRDDLLAHAVSEWAGSDPDAACRWASQVQDPELHDRLVASVGISAATRDPVIAFVLVTQMTPPGEHRDRAIAYITRRWRPESRETSWPGFPEMDRPVVREEASRELESLRQGDTAQVAKNDPVVAMERILPKAAHHVTDPIP